METLKIENLFYFVKHCIVYLYLLGINKYAQSARDCYNCSDSYLILNRNGKNIEG